MILLLAPQGGKHTALDRAPLEVLRDQLTVRSLDGLATGLPEAVYRENFAFYGKMLKGTPEPDPRWRRAVVFIEAALGDAIGREYAARYFTPSTGQAWTCWPPM